MKKNVGTAFLPSVRNGDDGREKSRPYTRRKSVGTRHGVSALIVMFMFALIIGMGASANMRVSAQDVTPTPTPDPLAEAQALGVWVTTQDFSILREGPGKTFKKLLVVPSSTTIPAIGRSPDTRWVQVIYEGQRGWIASWLLVWSGNVSELPVDGINPVPFARRIGVLGITTRETPIYKDSVAPENQVGTLPAGTKVEVTARLGRAEFMQFQINYQGEVYWVGSYNLQIRDSRWLDLVDTSYLYPYGRLVGTLRQEISRALDSLSFIEFIWTTLDSGQAVSCQFIPRQASLDRVTEQDLNNEPVFRPAADAARVGVDKTNAAITAFEDACSRPPDQFFITDAEVQQALQDITDARRNFNLAESLLRSLSTRDPLVNPDERGKSAFK